MRNRTPDSTTLFPAQRLADSSRGLWIDEHHRSVMLGT